MNSPRTWLNAIFVAIGLAISVWAGFASADESPATDTSASTESTGLIDFTRDVQPLFASKCLRCHGPEEAKNDFRVDEAGTVLSYIEPGDAPASSLWTDYLVTHDNEMRMPPASDKPEEKLSGIELATIKLWIEEGAQWNVSNDASSESVETPLPATLLARVWQFQGLFHPATTHFPIALLTVSSGFVLLSFFRRESCEPVAFHCLWIGALGAIAASLAGWSYAAHEGYGEGFSFDFRGSAIDRHRWLGVAVAALALILIPMAAYVRRTQDMGMRFMWLLGSLLLLGAVGTAGYQGGELTYGEGHYEQEFKRLFPEVTAGKQVEVAVDEKSSLEGQAEDSSENQADTNGAQSPEEPDASDSSKDDSSDDEKTSAQASEEAVSEQQ